MNTKDSLALIKMLKECAFLKESFKNLKNDDIKQKNEKVFYFIYEDKKYWIKKAGKTGSNLLHKLAYKIIKNPLLLPVADKSPSQSIEHEALKIKRLSQSGISVPSLTGYNENCLVMEDCGQTLQSMIRAKIKAGESPNKLIEKAIIELAKLHKIGEYHGGSQLRNFLYKDEKIYIIDFEDSFDRNIDKKSLQFRDLFLFLFALRKLDIKNVNFKNLIEEYIIASKNHDFKKRFKTLAKDTSFLLSILKCNFIKKLSGKDGTRIYDLFETLKNCGF